MMLTVHHLGISQSDRAVWLCEELGIDYQLKRYERDPVTRAAPPEYKALHPAGTAPIITDGDLALGESGAILDYIIGRYGNGRLAVTSAHPNFPDYLYWFHFANGSMMPSALIELVITMVTGRPDAPGTEQLRKRGDIAFAMVEKRLGEVPYFAGDQFTAADIMMHYPLTSMRRPVPRDISPYPNLLAYLRRIGERPAYQSAMGKADPGLAPLLT
jgi:glutathione S-transferase